MIGFTPFSADRANRYRQDGYWRGEVLGDLLRTWARTDGQRIALVDRERRWTYAQLDQKVDRIAAGFLQLGIHPGDRLVIQLPNIAEFAIATLALFRVGALPVFALAAHRRAEITYLCERSEAVAYLTTDTHFGFDYRALAREVTATIKTLRNVIVVGTAEEFVSFALLDSEPRSLPSPAPSDVAFFLLSGGTTGLPKLIPRTHDDYALQLRATAEALKCGEQSVYLAALPVAHNAAFGCPGLLGTLHVGGKVVLAQSPSPDLAFPLIVREGVTLTTLMPPLVHLWLDSAEIDAIDFSGVLLQVGSARLAPELARRVRSQLHCRITQWFGMAEGLLTYTRLDDSKDVIDNTVGCPLCKADEVRIVDENDVDVPSGATGELLTRGPYTLCGYYKAPEHNSRSFTSDGFLRTGDLVSLTIDGNLVVEGRRKDVINRGGEKIVPTEIEDVLLCHPDVREVAVVAMPDEVMGEKVCAFIVPREKPLLLAEARTCLRKAGLADFKLPERLEHLEALPRTPVGKIDKSRLRQRLIVTDENRGF